MVPYIQRDCLAHSLTLSLTNQLTDLFEQLLKTRPNQLKILNITCSRQTKLTDISGHKLLKINKKLTA